MNSPENQEAAQDVSGGFAGKNPRPHEFQSEKETGDVNRIKPSRNPSYRITLQYKFRETTFR
ncbi:hypothetical protein KFK09_013723 [Dendrobium nobile]|uniref:Uncharacterized protein n=1 Tax=Dendrobium nobile TaxID=94219 RepID=A0A8T3B884_DENNO|nr:hypothetical protein KFK09_013723 [Dendrobium nobile]